jgi:hypothetical protein
MEDVAQLAERRPVEANVAGSFPVILPKSKCFSTIKTTFKKTKVVLILKSHSVLKRDGISKISKTLEVFE